MDSFQLGAHKSLQTATSPLQGNQTGLTTERECFRSQIFTLTYLHQNEFTHSLSSHAKSRVKLLALRCLCTLEVSQRQSKALLVLLVLLVQDPHRRSLMASGRDDGSGS